MSIVRRLDRLPMPRMRARPVCWRLGRSRAGLAMFLLLNAATAAAVDTAAVEVELAGLRAQIAQVIGNPSCANLVHCRLLPLGLRPCGGPDQYLAYSSIQTDRIRLENLALEYGLMQEDLQRARGSAGACVLLPTPRLACVDNRCRTE